MKELTFSQLINECHKSLDALMAESQQTLNLAELVKKFPQDRDRKATLQLQSLRENRVRLGYEARRNELLGLLVGHNETNGLMKRPESSTPEPRKMRAGGGER